MTTRVAINGFGRLGRTFYRAAMQAQAGHALEIVAANDLGSKEEMAHLLEFDSIAGHLSEPVSITADGLKIGDRELKIFSESEPGRLPWRDLNIDVVVESTRFFTTRHAAAAHLEAGARTVVVSAPSEGADATFVVGVNDQDFDPVAHRVVSNASCTTNCLVPMVKVLDDAFGIDRGLMTTVHAYTSEQLLVDGPHRDLRRARSAGLNIVPTSTGAARATGLVLTGLSGRLDGSALRVPIADGSITDLTAVLAREVSAEEINDAFRIATTDGPLSRVLEYSDKQIVSSDIVGTAASCTFDAPLTITMGNLVKVFGWYDNEWGYSNRLVDLCEIIGKKLP